MDAKRPARRAARPVEPHGPHLLVVAQVDAWRDELVGAVQRAEPLGALLAQADEVVHERVLPLEDLVHRDVG